VSSYQLEILMEEDQRSILIIEGIQIFMPIIPRESSAQILGAVEEKGQPDVSVIKEEENEHTLMSTLVEKEDHTVNMLTQWDKRVGYVGGLAE
jgi:hypothetical protein